MKPAIIAIAFATIMAEPGLALDVRFSDSSAGKGKCWQGWCLIDCNMNCNWIRINSIDGSNIQYSSTSIHPEQRKLQWAPLWEYEVNCESKLHKPADSKEWTIPVKTSRTEAHLDFLCNADYQYDIINEGAR